jgi:predicted aspartyl protease
MPPRLPFNFLSLSLLLASFPLRAGAEVRFRSVAGMMVVPIRVNGQGPFEFLFDTGTTTTMLERKLLHHLALPAEGTAEVATPGGARSAWRTRVEEVVLGDLRIEGLPVLAGSLGGPAAELGGVLGQDVLSEQEYLLDYRNQRVVFACGAPAGERLPVERDRGRLLVPAACRSNQRLRLVLDTGAAQLVLFRAKGLDLALDGPPAQLATSAGRKLVRTGRLRTLRLGATALEDLETVLVPAPERLEDGLLPARFFETLYVNGREAYVILNPR